MWGSSIYPLNAGIPSELYLQKRTQILRPGERFVFLDEGKRPSSPWGIWHNQPMWWDIPTIRHSNGTNWSYADGYSDYYK